MQTVKEFHALANLFPLIEGAAFAELVADIKANGVREPVWTLEGKILDGRNRWRAAQAAQKPVTFREFDGADPVAFVISMNLHRRHLDESQRSLIASKLATLEQGRPQKNGSKEPISQEKAAELMRVSRTSVKRARKVIEHAAPQVVAAVERGELSVAAAQSIAQAPKDQQAKALKAGKQAVRALAKKQPKKKARAKSPADERRERYADLLRDLTAEPFVNSRSAILLEEFFGMRIKPLDFIMLGTRAQVLTKKLSAFARACEQQIVRRRKQLAELRASIKKGRAQVRAAAKKKRAKLAKRARRR